MASAAWKAFERASADLFRGARFWANSGERLDFDGRTREGLKIKGQCKLVKTLSLEALTKLAEETDVDVVCVKRRRGSGKKSSGLVVMTFENFQRLYGQDKETEAAETAIRRERLEMHKVRKAILPPAYVERAEHLSTVREP